ncbi:MAG: ribonuclease HI family protein [Halobacteriales archaeon]|nr:ribonuclease HI family protein [Halobacteriales archaeon]
MKGTLWFDGASRGNPGPGGAGAVLLVEGERVRVSEPLPRATNNVAEYHGLIAGLRAARDQGVTHLEVRGDSELVLFQMAGRYRVRTPWLVPLHAEAQGLARQFAAIAYRPVPRAENHEADAQANLGADAAARALQGRAGAGTG